MSEKHDSASPVAPGRQGRRLRFGIGNILLAIAVCSIPLGLLSSRIHRGRAQRPAVAAIGRAGGLVWYDFHFDANGDPLRKLDLPGPAWLRDWLGIDAMARVREVEFHGRGSNPAVPPLQTDAEVFDRIGQLTDLEVLNVSGVAIANDLLQRLARLRSLRSMDLRNTGADDEGLSILGQLPALESLDLANTRIVGRGLASLASCRNLKRLSLAGCSLTADAYERLPACDSLTELDLSATPLDDDGLLRLHGLVRLQKLNLSHTAVTDTGLAVLAGMRDLKTLDLSFTRVVGPGLANLRQCPSLRMLSLESSPLEDAGLDLVADVPSIAELNIRGCAITQNGLARLARLPRLRNVQASKASLWKFSGNRLASFRKLATAKIGKYPLTDERAGPGAPLTPLEHAAIGVPTEEEHRQLLENLDRLATRLRAGPPLLSRYVLMAVDENRLDQPWRDRLLPKVAPRIDELYRIAARLPPPPDDSLFLTWGRFGRAALPTDEFQTLVKVRIQPSPDRELLEAVVAIGDFASACFAAAVADHPRPETWLALIASLQPPLQGRAIAAWRESDPANAAVWYFGEGRQLASISSDDLLPAVLRGNDCPELRLGPPTTFDAELLQQALTLLEESGIPSTPQRLEEIAQSPWHDDRVLTVAMNIVRKLYAVEGDLRRSGKSAEAAACQAAADGMTMKMLVAPPQEGYTFILGAQLTGHVVLEMSPAPGMGMLSPPVHFGPRLRQDAIAALVYELFRQPGYSTWWQNIDPECARNAGWARGLAHGADERARQIILDHEERLRRREGPMVNSAPQTPADSSGSLPRP